MTAPCATPALSDGQTIVKRAGHVVITLQCVREGVYNVAVHTTAGQVDSCSYTNLDEARREANRMRTLYRTGLSVPQVEQRRADLVDLIEAADRRRGPQAIHRANQLRGEADAVALLRPAKTDRDLAASIAATITAAYEAALVPA